MLDLQVSHEAPAFKIDATPGLKKGMGMFATRPIARGELILFEKPVLTIDSLQVWSEMIGKFARLTDTHRNAFYALSNCLTDESAPRELGIIKTNGLPLGKDAVATGVFATIARINHSCAPNAHFNWNRSRGTATIYCLREMVLHSLVFALRPDSVRV